MLLLVVADELLPDAETEQLLRRLRAQHEILWLTVRDADLLGAGAGSCADSYDVAGTTAGPRSGDAAGPRAGLLPGGLAESAAIAGRTRGPGTNGTRRGSRCCAGWASPKPTPAAADDVIPTVFTLLARHRRRR